jgi:hypothetical protein
MKAAFPLILSFALFLTNACKKCDHQQEVYRSHAQITGPDYRKCATCGGYFILIEGQQYRFYELPSGSGINLEAEPMPVNVSLNWHLDTLAFAPDIIKVDAIRKD